MSAVTKRTVPRWFYKGKGYATATAAYKAKAKDLLKDELYGDRSCFSRPFDASRDVAGFDVPPEPLPELVPLSDEEAKVVAIDILSRRFPHSDDCSLGDPQTACYMDDYGDFLRPWCRRAYSAWIAATAQALREAAE